MRVTLKRLFKLVNDLSWGLFIVSLMCSFIGVGVLLQKTWPVTSLWIGTTSVLGLIVSLALLTFQEVFLARRLRNAVRQRILANKSSRE